MSAVTVTLTSICSGGGHLTFAVTGDVSREQTLDQPVLLDPVSNEEAEAFLKVICKLAKKGRTNAQARTLLQAGVAVTI